MNINSLILNLDNFANGGPIYATHVARAFEYVNGERTEKVIGLKVTAVFSGNNFQTQIVTVADTVDTLSAAIEKADASHPVHVTFDDFKAKVYVMNGKAGISAKASAVHIVQPPATKDDFDFG